MIDPTTVGRWLREDLGHHDVTNDVPGGTDGRLVAKALGTAAGMEAAAAVFEYLDVEVSERVEAGTTLDAGDVALRVEGSAQDVLRAERTAVNVAGHASGVATKTASAVNAAEDAVAETASVDEPPAIAGTRKTTPGLRGVEKRAIAAGGGDTHRLDLSHMVMVKDNHVAELGMDAAIERFREQASFATKIEVEVEAVEDAPRAAGAGADIVLLDNMTPAEVEQAVSLLAESGVDALLEASGGITVETIPEYATTGVDVISLGSLTHSAASLDFSFRTR